MDKPFIAHLEDRGVVAVTGADAVKFLNGLVTNEVAHLAEGEAAYAGLLSPQGKILFAFFAVRTADGFFLDVAREKAADLVKRLSLYKLRAAVTIADVSERFDVWVAKDESSIAKHIPNVALSFRDPRHEAMGLRIFSPHEASASAVPSNDGVNAYVAQRIALGVPEGGKDYEFGDTYPHEADFDWFNGASFAKGCYVGQEVVSRMKHKTVVRKRVVRITGETNLKPGADITIGTVVIGRTGSVDGVHGLALLRLDRYAEAREAGQTVSVADTPIQVCDDDFTRYAETVAKREKA
ncbi:MAG: folate-binding protein YgfZ [Hyphomicrobium sp.]